MKITEYIHKINNLEKKNAARLHLTANENRMSRTAANFLSTKLSERYFFGGGKII
jgi:glycine/serine hydroxymethyltransferase